MFLLLELLVTWTVYRVSSADMDQVSIRDFKTGVAVICFASMAVYFMVFYVQHDCARLPYRARPVENFKDWIYPDEPPVPERPAAPPPIDLTDGWAGFWRSLRRGE